MQLGYNDILKFGRPCFVPDAKFKYALARYKGKEELSGFFKTFIINQIAPKS